MTMLEAMACGKPLLIADSTESASTDFVSDNDLLFKAGDPEDRAAQLEPITWSMKNDGTFDHASPLRSQAGGTCWQVPSGRVHWEIEINDVLISTAAGASA